MAQIVGFVQKINGIFKAVDANGHERVLHAGDPVYAGETVVGDHGSNSTIVVAFEDEHRPAVLLSGNETLHFDASMLRSAWNGEEATIHDHKNFHNVVAGTENIDNVTTAAGTTGTSSQDADLAFSFDARTAGQVDVNSQLHQAPFTQTQVTQSGQGTTNIVPTLLPDAGVVYESALYNGTHPNAAGTVFSGNLFTNDTLPNGTSLYNVTIAGGASDTSVAGQITVTTAQGNTLVVNEASGAFTYTLNHPFQDPVGADSVVDTFIYSMKSVAGVTYSSNLDITIYDDNPIVKQNTPLNVPVHDISTNLVLTLDASGSMHDSSTVLIPDTNKFYTKFEVAVNALINNIESYSKLGTVNVDLTLFSTYAVNIADPNNDGTSVWMSSNKAISYLQGLLAESQNGTLWVSTHNSKGETVYINTMGVADSSVNTGNTNNTYYNTAYGNSTNFQDALSQTETQDGFHSIKADQTVAYFLSDGQPTVSIVNGHWSFSDAKTPYLTNTDLANWDSFISANNIDLTVMTDSTTTTAHDYMQDVQNADTSNSVILVADPSSFAVSPDVFSPVEGNLYNSLNINYGADGGHIQSLKYLGENGVLNTSAITFDATNSTQQLTLSHGTMTIDFSTGDFSYTQTSALTSGNTLTENFNITVIDNDGDTATSPLDITIADGTGSFTYTYTGATGEVVIGDNNSNSYDTIKLAAGVNLTTSIDFKHLHNIEQIDLSSNGNHNIGNATTGLQVQDVLNMTNLAPDGVSHILEITDNKSGDGVTLQNGWHTSGQVVENGHTYNEYSNISNSDVIVKVDDHINTTLI